MENQGNILLRLRGALRATLLIGVCLNTALGQSQANIVDTHHVFQEEIYAAPRSWTEKAYPKLAYYHRLPIGGHFAAWEQPQLFSQELRAAFRSLR